MKKIVSMAAVLLLAGCNADDKSATGESAALDNESAKFSYAIGLDIGHRLAGISEPLNMAAFNKGVTTAMTGGESELTTEQIIEVKQAVMKREQAKAMEKQEKLAVENKAEGGKFLQENASAEGVKTTPSGLQYKVLTEGSGAKPTLDDVVKVNYEGKLLKNGKPDDDTVFDSSYRRGEPVTIQLRRVIKGWQEGLQLMTVGSKYQFFIPSELAYGESGAGDVIGPNAVLVFDIELLDIVTPEATAK